MNRKRLHSQEGCIPPIRDMSIMYAYARARVQCFYVFAFTSSHFGRKSLIDCVLRVKASPFCLHRFFATNVMQCVVFQIVAVNVKVNAGFAFTLKQLIYSLLWGEVKGEGKNGKFAERASAYIRVGACPARRVKGILCGVGRFEIKQGRKSRKVGTFGEKVGLYFSSGVWEAEKNNFSCSVVLGFLCVVRLLLDLVFLLFCDVLLLFVLGFLISASPFFILILFRLLLGEKNACFSFYYACKSRNSGELQAKTPRQTDFFGAKCDFGREFLAR